MDYEVVKVIDIMFKGGPRYLKAIVKYYGFSFCFGMFLTRKCEIRERMISYVLGFRFGA
mgnify:CR=1 FL=1